MANEFDQLIIKSAETFRLDANLLRAIITIESSWNPKATRFEPHWHYFNRPSDFAHHLGISVDEEEKNQATSWGLGQVMGAVAREHGFTDHLEMLTTPDIGVFYMCKHLRRFFDRYGDEEDVVSAYNQGNNRKSDGGLYLNQSYVDKVYKVLRALRALT